MRLTNFDALLDHANKGGTVNCSYRAAVVRAEAHHVLKAKTRRMLARKPWRRRAVQAQTGTQMLGEFLVDAFVEGA